MGLHRARSASESVSPEETQERFKVFRSLYLRDVSSSISRGSTCWLSGIDCSLSLDLDGSGFEDSTSTARIQLAWLEDESYRLSLAAGSPRRTPAEFTSALLRIEHRLENWANAHEIFSSSYPSTHNVDLKLGFLAARMFILRKSLEPRHLRRALDDSRASCLLVVIACGKHEPSMIDQLDVLVLPKSSSKSLGERRLSESVQTSSSRFTKQETSTLESSRLYSLFDTFSLSAFFILAKSVIWPSSGYGESKAEQDLDLLQRTCACFKEFNEFNQEDNHMRKVGGVFQSLIEVVELIRSPQQHQSRHFDMQQSINVHNASTALHELNQLSKFNNLPRSSAPLVRVPPTSWDTFSINNALTTNPDIQNTSTTPGLVTPLDTHYQPYDPLPQPPFFPHMQQQMMQPSGSNHQYTCVSDAPMDVYADARLLSESLASNPSMSYTVD